MKSLETFVYFQSLDGPNLNEDTLREQMRILNDLHDAFVTGRLDPINLTAHYLDNMV